MTTRKRKRASRRRRRIAYPLQLAMALGGTVLAAWLLVAFLGKVVYPYRLGNKVGGDLTLTRSQLVQQKNLNLSLRQEIQMLKTTEGVEREARRAHFRRGNETIYLLQQPIPPPPLDPLKPQPGSGN